MLVIADWGILFSTVTLQAGPRSQYSAIAAIKLGFYAIPIWATAMSLIKSGIAITLLRIRSTRLWNFLLYSIIVIQVGFGIHNVAFALLQCQPMEAAWNPNIPGATCFRPSTIRTQSTVSSAVNITTDILLSAAPITFLINLRKSLAEKALLISVMSLGLFASGASIIKSMHVQDFGRFSQDPWSIMLSIFAWTTIELLIAAIAASAVCLRSVLRRALARFGVTLDSAPKLDLAKIEIELSSPSPCPDCERLTHGSAAHRGGDTGSSIAL